MSDSIIKQSLDRIKFTQLKGLKNLDINFGDKKNYRNFWCKWLRKINYFACVGMFV